MIYVLDNNIFSRAFHNFSFRAFEDDIWGPWSMLIKQGRIISVDEVFCELSQHWDPSTEAGMWLKEHKECFQKTTNEEGFVVAEIFRNKKFREGIKEKSLRNGSPEADALLVAKAKITKGIVVTAESDEKPNSEKIPNIAVALGVPYMKIDSFHILLKNIYNKRPEHQRVEIYSTLGHAGIFG